MTKAYVLVTGGGGFLGSSIVKQLRQKGWPVISYSRRHHARLESLGVKQMQADLADKKKITKAADGAAMVFHVAAKAGVWGAYSDYFKANVIATQNVIHACREASQVPILIYTSSPAVVFNGKNIQGADESLPYPQSYSAHYAHTKALAERAVIEAGKKDLATIVLRPHLIWGPGDNHLVPRIISRAKRMVQVGNGRNRVDTVYIDNAAEAHLLAAQALKKRPGLSGKVYFISQDDPRPLWEMINAILKAADLPPVTRSVPKSIAWTAGALFEMIFRTLKLPGEPPITRFVAEELSSAHWFNIQAAKTDLGYRPSISIEEGLYRLEKWLQNDGL